MNLSNYLTEKDFIQMPITWCANDFFTISFEGWGFTTFELDDPTFNEMMDMATRTLDCFIRLYKDDRVFTEPELRLKPDGSFSIKIGTLEKEEYERRLKSYEDK